LSQNLIIYVSFFQKYNFPVTERENFVENFNDSELSGHLATSDMLRNYSAILMCAGLGFLTIAPEFVESREQIATSVSGAFFLCAGYCFGEAYVADARETINVAKSRGLEILKKPFFRHVRLNGGD